ncbi:MAG: aminotransferase class V-fold PLP-dependent enzyme [Gemmatimonadota bacterium]
MEHRTGGGSLTRRQLLAGAGSLAATAWVPGLVRPVHGTAAGAPATQQAFPRKADFVIPEGVTYINGAYMHPMPTVARDAVGEYLERRAGFTTQTSASPDISGDVKAEFAALINAAPHEIAFVPNTSTGEVLVVHGLGIPGSGGNVVTDALHFEGAIVHLQALERSAGLDLRIVMPYEGAIRLEDLERAIDRDTRLVELSLVTMYNGFQHDLEAVCELAHAHGAYVYADIIQAAGAVPIDVRASGVDFAACSGFKWLMGDLGLGFLYVREDLIGRVLERTQTGYHSVSRYGTHFLPFDPPGSAPFTWDFGTSASAHFEVGSVAGAARAALGASIPYLRHLDPARIEAHRQPLLGRLREEMPRLGFECVTPEGTTSPIITFAMADGTGVEERLKRAGVDVRVAEHYIRFSPSVYNDMADIERALEALS